MRAPIVPCIQDAGMPLSLAAPVVVSAPPTRRPRSWNRTKSPPPSSRSKSAPPRCGGIFDYDAKRERLEEVNRELENPAVWSDPERAQNLGRERAELEAVVATLNRVEKSLDEAGELHELAREEQDAEHARRRRSGKSRASRRSSSCSSSAACSRARWTRTTRSSTSRPARAAPRRRIGRRCCCACI